MSDARLIVGLGNPGSDYEYTRHNLGFLVIFRLAEKLNFKLRLSSFTNGLMAEGNYKGCYLYLLMPLTFMNNSGQAVKRVIVNKDVSFENILVITDDFNLDFFQMRLRPRGSDGGHNGLGSIVQCCETQDFARLRMGIGFPEKGKAVVDYVLEEFTQSEKDNLTEYINEALDCCLLWLEEGTAKAMERFNRKR